MSEKDSPLFLVLDKGTQEQRESNLARQSTFEESLNNPNQVKEDPEVVVVVGSSHSVYPTAGWGLWVTPLVGA